MMDEQIRSLPRLGERAPDFEASTTHGKVKLSDYKGKWLVLFSHPADFTPVCTTEFAAFAEVQPQLKELNCELLGLSIDSTFSHIAWVRNIEEKLGVKITFPIVADLDMKVSSLFGMIHPQLGNTATVRAVFVLDDQGILRSMIYYPMTTGRNMDEIVRLVQALQTADKHKVATPANWRPGDKVIVPPPQTTEAAAERLNQGYECIDWYLCKKSLPNS